MVMRVQTGPVSAPHAERVEIKGKNGGPSPNNREIAAAIASDSPNLRLFAFIRVFDKPMALAYLAVTAQHDDVRNAAKKEMLVCGLQILSTMTGRTLEPWEKEVVRAIKEGMSDYNGWDKALIDAKLTQIERGKYFEAYDQVCGVDFVDISPPEFSEEILARILDHE